MEYLKAVILAIVEGVTEFLPISSTGHMILVEDFLRLGSEEFAKTFIVVIQFPAILAVALYFIRDLWPLEGVRIHRGRFVLWTKILTAFVPTAVAGLLLNDYIEAMLDSSLVVATTLVLGGIVLIVLERRGMGGRLASARDLSYGAAFAVGCIQSIAMVPGVSRSAATIIGAMLLGASRAAAAEFSFFLAIPTMAAATAFTILKSGLSFSTQEWALIAVASVVSFAVAYGVVAFLMRFIRRRSFAVFGWYRIALGIIVLFVLFALPAILG